MTTARCTHCGNPPTIKSEFWPWFSVRIGPVGAWSHHYCSESCHAYADEHSAIAWRSLSPRFHGAYSHLKETDATRNA